MARTPQKSNVWQPPSHGEGHSAIALKMNLDENLWNVQNCKKTCTFQFPTSPQMDWCWDPMHKIMQCQTQKCGRTVLNSSPFGGYQTWVSVQFWTFHSISSKNMSMKIDSHPSWVGASECDFCMHIWISHAIHSKKMFLSIEFHPTLMTGVPWWTWVSYTNLNVLLNS